MEYLLLTLMITILYPGYITTITASSAPPNAVDYCKLQVFQPRCDHNEVILIEHARYGRMRQGTCITRSRELNGCQSDVLSIAHRKCSGRRECDVIVPDVEFEATNPCEDLLSYLEVAYSCVQVVTAREESCSTCDVMKVTAPPSGYIASLTTALSRCGGVECPWLIEAARGQRIQLTLVDFAGRDRAFQQTGICRVYTTIKEPATEKSVTVCGGRAAEQIVYTSLGNAVEIRILALSGDEDTFLLRYQFIGCGEPAIGAGASYTREGDDIHGRCDEFGYTWSLHCNGTAWVGHLPNCSLPYSANNPDGNSAASGAVSEIAAGSALSFSWEMALVLITIVTVGVVACVLIVGIVCIKRTRQPYIPTAAPQGEPIYALYDVTARRPSVKHYMGYNSLPKDFSTLCKLYNTDTMHSCPYNNNTIANRYCGSATMRDMRNHEPPFRTTRRPAGYAPVAPPLIPEVDFHAEIPPGQQYSSLMDNRPLPSPPPPWEGGEATE